MRGYEKALPEMGTSVLLALAAVVTLIALAIGGYVWWREQLHATTSYVDELDDKSYIDLDFDTAERETYAKMAEAYAEDPRRVSNDMLSGALLRRAMAMVPHIERVERDRPSVHRLSQNSYIPFSIVDELMEAETLLDGEIKEVQAEAERLRPGWGRAVYAQAYDIVRRQRAEAQREGERAAPPAKPAAAKPAAPLAAEGAAADGASTPPFSWSQTTEEVELAIRVPAGTHKKDVSVQFGTQTCTVRVSGSGAPPVMGGRLAHKVNADECTWSLVGDGEARKLHVTLFKQQAAEWRQLMASV